MGSIDLLHLVLEVNYRNLALGHEVFNAAGATFVRNRTLPFIYDANFVFGIRASTPADIAATLAAASHEHTGASRLTFRTDDLTPAPFKARLVSDGYEITETALLILEGSLNLATNAHEIRPVTGSAMWQQYTDLKRRDWRESAAHIGEDPADMRVPDGLSAASQLKCPPATYLMAYHGDRAVGFCSAWEGIGGMGQVEDLYVHPDFRHRGIATALLQRAVHTARARGASTVLIATDPNDTPQRMYEALGWSYFTTCRQYFRVVRRGL